MEKKKSNILPIAIGLGLLAGGFFAIKKGLFKKKAVTNTDIKDVQKNQDIANQLLAQENKAKASTISLQNPTSDKSKIAKIQSYLGVAIDGILGPQTYQAIINKLPNLAGQVSIADLNANIDTLYQIFVSKGWVTA